MVNTFTKQECELIVSNVKYLAGLKGWNTITLSKKAGISYTTINQFVNNKHYLKICNLQRIAKALKTTIPNLLKIER